MSQKKKILMVIRLIGGRSGGAERIYCELASQFASRDYDVTCVHFDYKDVPIFYPIDKRVNVINLAPIYKSLGHRVVNFVSNAKYIIFPNEIRNRIRWRLRNKMFVDQLTSVMKSINPDVAISFLPPANTPTLLAGNRSGVKVIPTNHNVPIEDYASNGRWDQNPVDKRLRLEALKYSAANHVLFEKFADWFRKEIRKKTVSIPNYISSTIVGKKIPTQREKRVIGVGRLASVKNYEELIVAWKEVYDKHPDWELDIFGIGPEKSRLEKLIRNLRIETVCHIRGHTHQIGDALISSSIFCHPAHFEGFGLAPAEGLAVGLPVVCYSDCEGVNQFVDDSNGKLVDRKEGARGLANAINYLIENEDERQRLSQNALKIRKKYSMERFVFAWIELIEKINVEK